MCRRFSVPEEILMNPVTTFPPATEEFDPDDEMTTDPIVDDGNDEDEIDEEEIADEDEIVEEEINDEDQERLGPDREEDYDEFENEMWEYFEAIRAETIEAEKDQVEVEVDFDDDDDEEHCDCECTMSCYGPRDEFRMGGLVKQDPVTYKTPEVLLAAQFAVDEENKSKERHLEIVEIVEYSCKKSSFGGVIKHIILNARDDIVVNAYETVVWVKRDGTFKLVCVVAAFPGDKGEVKSKEEEEEMKETDSMINWPTMGFGVGWGLSVGRGDPMDSKVVTAAQFALAEENKYMNMNLELVAVEKCYYKESPYHGVMRRIFLSARDGPEVNVYDTMVVDSVKGTLDVVTWERLDSTHQIS